MKKNSIIYDEAKKNGIHLWQIAKKIGIADTTFSKKMRQELSQREKDYILSIIRQIAKENKPDDTSILLGDFK